MMPSGSSKGSGRSSTVLTRLKIAVFAPMPSASTPIATSANAGARDGDTERETDVGQSMRSMESPCTNQTRWTWHGAGSGVTRHRRVCRQNQRRASTGEVGVTVAELFVEVAEDEVPPSRGCPPSEQPDGEGRRPRGVISPPDVARGRRSCS